MASFAREVARRVFASELRDSNYTFREDDSDYAPLYLITPTGARCNRVLLVGTLTEKDNLGDDVEYWRGRVADPTGSIFVYAGQYQPDAAQALSATEPPAFVAVVGKPSVYETEDGKRLISVRAESVQKVDAETRDRWLLESAARTLDRIEAFKAFLEMGGADAFSSGDELLKKPSSPAEMADIGKAHLHYSPDLERYRQMVVRALFALKGEISEPRIEAAKPKAEKRKAGSGRAGPVWEEESSVGGPEEEIGDVEELEEHFTFEEEEGPEDVEGIEEEEVFFGGREKASPKKRRER